jgi:hypothetical protein
MRNCKHCNEPVWKPGEETRGRHNRRLCRRCWALLLVESIQRATTLKELALKYGVSVPAISQKRHYLLEQGVS